MGTLIPEKLRKTIPQLGAASEQEDPMVWAKLTAPGVGWTWYVIETQPLPPDAIFYGYAVGWDETLEYFNLSELEQIAAVEGVSLVCDPTFAPSRLSVVRAHERGPAKFPFGEVVATPGAVAALQQTGEHPLTYLRRHAHGDWGELDADGIAENELSLVNGFRLLSAYTLKDGTHIWIITEADRSATTLLLPSEYQLAGGKKGAYQMDSVVIVDGRRDDPQARRLVCHLPLSQTTSVALVLMAPYWRLYLVVA